jgi:hypothetical protein
MDMVEEAKKRYGEVVLVRRSYGYPAGTTGVVLHPDESMTLHTMVMVCFPSYDKMLWVYRTSLAVKLTDDIQQNLEKLVTAAHLTRANRAHVLSLLRDGYIKQRLTLTDHELGSMVLHLFWIGIQELRGSKQSLDKVVALLQLMNKDCPDKVQSYLRQLLESKKMGYYVTH